MNALDDVWRLTGEWILWTSAIVVALGALFTKTGLRRIVSWVWRKSVTEPISKWLEALMERVFNRLIEPFKSSNEKQHDSVQQRLAAVEEQMAGVVVNTRYLAMRSEDHDKQLETQATSMHEQGDAMNRMAGALDALEQIVATMNAKTKETNP